MLLILWSHLSGSLWRFCLVCLQNNKVKKNYKKWPTWKTTSKEQSSVWFLSTKNYLPCVHKGFVKLFREFWMLFFFRLLEGSPSTVAECLCNWSARLPVPENWSCIFGLVALWGADAARGCFLQLFFFSVQEVFNEMSQYQRCISPWSFTTLLIYVGFTLCFFLQCFLSGCLNCRHQRSAELAFGELASMLLAEQPSIWTAKPPKMLIRPG